jgi:hypothetical protein
VEVLLAWLVCACGRGLATSSVNIAVIMLVLVSVATALLTLRSPCRQSTGYRVSRSAAARLLLSDLPDEALGTALTPRESKTACSLQIRLGLSDEEAIKTLLRHPSLLGYSFEANIDPTLSALEEALSLSPDELARIFIRSPAVIGLNVDDTLMPRISALRELFGIGTVGVRRMVLRHPTLLKYSIDANVRPTAEALRLLLGLSDSELRSLVLKYPQALSLNAKLNIEPSLTALRELLWLEGAAGAAGADGVDGVDGADAATADVRRIVTRFPQVLGMNVCSNLRPKLMYLRSALDCSGSELRQMVMRHPGVLGSSLERCIRPNVDLWARSLPSGHQLSSMVEQHGLRFLVCSHARLSARIDLAKAHGVPAEAIAGKMRLTDAEFDRWLAGGARSRLKSQRPNQRLVDCEPQAQRQVQAEGASQEGGDAADVDRTGTDVDTPLRGDT